MHREVSQLDNLVTYSDRFWGIWIDNPRRRYLFRSHKVLSLVRPEVAGIQSRLMKILSRAREA